MDRKHIGSVQGGKTNAGLARRYWSRDYGVGCVRSEVFWRSIKPYHGLTDAVGKPGYLDLEVSGKRVARKYDNNKGDAKETQAGLSKHGGRGNSFSHALTQAIALETFYFPHVKPKLVSSRAAMLPFTKRQLQHSHRGAALMQPNLSVRYFIAILATSAFMFWMAKDTAPDLLDVALFWGFAVTAGWLQMLLIARGVRASFGAENFPGWALLLAQTFIGAVPLTFEVRWLMQTVVDPQDGLPPPWMSYLNVSVINFVLSLVQYVLVERWPVLVPARPQAELRAERERIDAANAIPTIGKLKRRPDGLNGRIHYMQMEDHYLRVHTDEGEGLALYRMSDAAADLADTDGMQVHRSWWVARATVKDVRKDRHKKTLIAKDGTEIPVGRSFEKNLRAAGWI